MLKSIVLYAPSSIIISTKSLSSNSRRETFIKTVRIAHEHRFQSKSKLVLAKEEMPRWTPEEHSQIEIVRNRLADLLNDAPNFPEVVGDRKIIRYLRGHDHNVDKVCDLYAKFLIWRKTAKVDDIRRDIVHGGMDHPLKFPKGELIQSLMPALIIAPDAHDSCGCPIVVDQYNFSPQTLLASFTLEDYILYATYCLEYRQIILEQLSEEREMEYLNSLTPQEREEAVKIDSGKPPFGVIAQSCVIRDLNGVGFEHLGAKGQEIIRAVVALASDNYPELMRKAFMINTPWIFNTVWYFIKGLLAARTVAKISIMGSTYIEEIEKEIPRENIPALIGGSYVGYQQYVPFPFNHKYLCPNAEAEATVLTIEEPAAEEISVTVFSTTETTIFVSDEGITQETSSISVISQTRTNNSNSQHHRQDQDSTIEMDISLISLQTSG